MLPLPRHGVSQQKGNALKCQGGPLGTQAPEHGDDDHSRWHIMPAMYKTTVPGGLHVH